MRTNPKSGSRKSVGLGPAVPRTGTIRSKPMKTSEPVATSADEKPSTEDIAKLAYALWEERGDNGGTAEDDWYRAEQLIRARS